MAYRSVGTLGTLTQPCMPRAPKHWHDTTKRSLDAIAPKAGQVFDAYFRSPKGFHVRVFPDGRKVFALRYKAGATYRRRTIGPYGVWTIDRAEKEAARLRLLVDDPQVLSPHDQDEADSALITVTQLVGDYIKDLGQSRTPRYVHDTSRYLETRIPVRLAKKLVAKVTVDDIRKIVNPLSERPAMHNRVRAALSGLFASAVARELIPRNPVSPLKSEYSAPREPDPLNAAQCFALGKALRSYEAEGKPWQPIAAIRLLYLSACRKSEILKLEWSEIEWEASALHLTKSKTLGTRRRDKRTVGEPVLTLLRAIQARHIKLGLTSKYVLPSPVDPRKPYTFALDAHWHRIRKAAGVPDMHLHDFRHNVLSAYGAEYEAAIGQAVSGHATKQHLDRYQKAQQNTVVKSAADRINEQLQSALDTEPTPLKLVG